MHARPAENLKTVNERIARAARRAGREPDAVRLVAVTKRRTPDEIRPLLEAGQLELGENRVQEFLEKIDAFDAQGPQRPRWHFIGHLQTRKAPKIAGRVELVHGVDSLRIAEALQRAAEKNDCRVDILLQANVSGEASKFGIEPDALEQVADGLEPLDRVRCKGLMTMAPFVADPEETRPVFRALREARDRLRQLGRDHLDMDELSMGMTNDYEIAVEEGATIVRIGTALFQ